MEVNKKPEHWKVLVMLLKEIAEEKGITQLQIATDTGMHQSHVSRFFQAKYKPNLDVFLQIAVAVNVNFFFEDKDSKVELNVLFERAMDKLYRRSMDGISKN